MLEIAYKVILFVIVIIAAWLALKIVNKSIDKSNYD
jgi:hypothetical protein